MHTCTWRSTSWTIFLRSPCLHGRYWLSHFPSPVCWTRLLDGFLTFRFVTFTGLFNGDSISLTYLEVFVRMNKTFFQYKYMHFQLSIDHSFIVTPGYPGRPQGLGCFQAHCSDPCLGKLSSLDCFYISRKVAKMIQRVLLCPLHGSPNANVLHSSSPL